MSRTPSADPITNWRNIVLYGRNVTTYKIALARTIADAVGPALGDGGTAIHRLLDHARRVAEDRGRWAS